MGRRRWPWNHNLHYARRLLPQLSVAGARVLDAGCGDGLLSAELAPVAQSVVALDVDPAVLEIARAERGVAGVSYVCGDLLSHPFPAGSFDVCLCVAALHHLDAERGLLRLAELVAPGGRVGIVGLARSSRVRDYAADAVGVVLNWWLRLTRGEHAQRAPTVWPPPLSYREVAELLRRTMPGVLVRRRLLFRYTAVWVKPAGPPPSPADLRR